MGADFGPILGKASIRGLRGNEEQEKALALFRTRTVTSTRSAGGFRKPGLTLFCRVHIPFDAGSSKTAPKARCCRGFNDAIPKKEEYTMKEEKKRHTIWLTDQAWDNVESHYQKDNCSTKNEYIEKAVQFYSGYLDAERAG